MVGSERTDFTDALSIAYDCIIFLDYVDGDAIRLMTLKENRKGINLWNGVQETDTVKFVQDNKERYNEIEKQIYSRFKPRFHWDDLFGNILAFIYITFKPLVMVTLGFIIGFIVRGFIK